jgi:tagaturonate reductase
VLQYADYWKLPVAFHEWVKDSCVFCNSLVDRIVTGYPKDNADQIAQRMGYNDLRLVAAEPYHLWVIEGDIRVRELLPADKAWLNVKFVPDLTPYRTSKVRILNGAHTAMTLVGYLRGLRTVRETVEDPWMASYLKGMITKEIIPTIPLPANELKEYARQVFERFSNPGITHELTSIALNSVSKFRTRLLPALLDYHHLTGKLPDHVVHTFGALVVFYRGTWKGQPLPVNDHPDVMKTMAAYWNNTSGEVDVHGMLANVALWGTDLNKVDHLTDGLSEAISLIVAEV